MRGNLLEKVVVVVLLVVVVVSIWCVAKLINFSAEFLEQTFCYTSRKTLLMCETVRLSLPPPITCAPHNTRTYRDESSCIRFLLLSLTRLFSTVTLCSSLWSWSLRCWPRRPSSQSTLPWRMTSCCLSTHRPWPPHPHRAPYQPQKVERLLMVCTVQEKLWHVWFLKVMF